MFEEKTINLKNLLLKVFMKWRMILLFALVFAAAVPAVKYLRDRKTIAARNQGVRYDSKENTLALADLYRQFEVANTSLKKYEILGTDLNGVHYIKLQYFVGVEDAKYDKLLPSEQLLAKIGANLTSAPEDIARLYTGYVSSAEFINKLIDGTDISEAVFRQYMKTSVNGHNFTISLPLLAGMDESAARAEAKELIGAQSERFQFAGDHDLTLVAQHMTTEVADDVIGNQYTAINQVYNINLWITNLEKTASKNDINYAKALAAGKVEMGKPYVDPSLTKRAHFSKKFVVIGFIIGIMLMCFYYACKFALSSRLQETDELGKATGIRLFATIEAPRKRKRRGLDAKLAYLLHNNKRKLNTEQQVAASVSAISLYCEQSGIKNVALSSTLFGKLDEELVSFIVNGLKLSGISCTYVDDVAYDKNALTACTKAGGTILVEQLGVSVLSEIEKEIKAASEYDIGIIGSIILE